MVTYVVVRDTTTELDRDNTLVTTNSLAEDVSYIKFEDALKKCERLAELEVAASACDESDVDVYRGKDYVRITWRTKKIYFKIVELIVK